MKAGTQCTTKSSQCAFDSTISRSGPRARNWSPIARIAVLTRPTCALSSVSGRVRNCGACGTIAAPTMPVEHFLSAGVIVELLRSTADASQYGDLWS